MTHEQRLIYWNDSPAEIELILEPWGESHRVLSGDRVELIGVGGDPGSAFEIHQTARGLIVFGWAGSVVNVVNHGFDVRRSSGRVDD